MGTASVAEQPINHARQLLLHNRRQIGLGPSDTQSGRFSIPPTRSVSGHNRLAKTAARNGCLALSTGSFEARHAGGWIAPIPAVGSGSMSSYDLRSAA